MKDLYLQLGVSPAVYAYGESVLTGLRERFAAVDAVAEYNQAKVIAAMQKNRVGASCFAATTGYGYDDVGRDVLERSMPTPSTRKPLSSARRSPAARTR